MCAGSLAERQKPISCQLSLEQTRRPAYGSAVMQHLKAKPKPSRTKRSVTRLSPAQLRRLADRLVASNDPSEVARLKAELERGFYGDPVPA